MKKPAVWAEGSQPCGRSDGPAASKDALLQAERLYYRLRIEQNLLTEAARSGTLSGMLERCYDCSERDLAELRTPSWLELDLRCCMAKRTSKKKVKREGAGSAWQKHEPTGHNRWPP